MSKVTAFGRASTKLKFRHPNEDRVFGEIVYSPYMTKPEVKYNRKMYTVQAKLAELRKDGLSVRDLPESERPYDIKETRKALIKEVHEFEPRFSFILPPVSM